jgi:hypothetical protein
VFREVVETRLADGLRRNEFLYLVVVRSNRKGSAHLLLLLLLTHLLSFGDSYQLAFLFVLFFIFRIIPAEFWGKKMVVMAGDFELVFFLSSRSLNEEQMCGIPKYQRSRLSGRRRRGPAAECHERPQLFKEKKRNILKNFLKKEKEQREKSVRVDCHLFFAGDFVPQSTCLPCHFSWRGRNLFPLCCVP